MCWICLWVSLDVEVRGGCEGHNFLFIEIFGILALKRVRQKMGSVSLSPGGKYDMRKMKLGRLWIIWSGKWMCIVGILCDVINSGFGI